MKKHLNTLFVTTQGTYLSKEGETVVISMEKKTLLRIPIHTLSGIICFGNVAASPFLLGFCAEKNVRVSFLTEYGRFLAGIHGKTSGNVLLRREQYRIADDEKFCLEISKFILTGKINNSRIVLQRAIRDYSDDMEQLKLSKIKSTVNHLKYLILQIHAEKKITNLRGIEGEAARQYFSVFNYLITNKNKDFYFNGRNRRPPLDRVNCMLSFLYTVLMHDVQSALESVGLDSYVGFLHKDRPGRAGLALDLMEELRPFLVDRLILTLINRNQIESKGFKVSEIGAVRMNDDTRKNILVAYQQRKQEELTHPYIKEKIKIGLLCYIQSLLLARHLRGDLDGYPVFIWR
jgi:CRISP-associated protein Cas1